MALATVSDRYTEQQIRTYYAEGLWRRDTMFGVLEEQVAQRPDKVFLSDAMTSCTFGDLHATALRLAAGLVRRGIRPGDRVAIQIPNWTEFAAICLANQPEATAAMYTADGFSRSGDLGTMDADGYVRVTGRLKDIVIRGGLNISVRQVEDLLTAHPGVSAVAVVGMPDETMGERVCCYLVPAAGADPLTLQQVKDYLLAAGLAVQKVPERVEVVGELPMTATGKIQKHLLRADIARKLSQLP